MEDLGISFVQMLADETSSSFVVAEASMRFLSPARLGDELEVHTSVAKMGRASVAFLQVVKDAQTQKALCQVTVKCAFVSGPGLKPTRMPKHYLSLFSH